MGVIFRAENHEYQSQNGENINWISVTGLTNLFKQKFDAISVSERVSKNRKSKWFGMTPTDIQAAWKSEAKRATELGTWYHNQRETDICGYTTITRDGVELPVVKPIVEDGGIKYAPEQKISEGIYPEHMVFLKSAGICGQSDLVEVVKGKVNITDYKTNKELKTEGFRNFEGLSTKMLQPVNHLDDCNLNHYALQLSLYMFIILKHNPHLSPGRLTLHHIIFEEVGKDRYGNPIARLDSHGDPVVKEVIPYDVPYLKNEVVSMIHWLKINRNTIPTKKAA